MAKPDPFVGPPYVRSDAARKTRLCNFDSTYKQQGYTLHLEHKNELDKLLNFVSQTSSFSVWIIGYASKKGNAVSNKQLSANRALAVENYLVSKNPLFGDEDRLARFDFVGDTGYIAARTDDSADERAVEIHIFIGNPKPPPPPGPIKPRPRPPLPGGPRFMQWEIATPGGIVLTFPVGGGFNVWFIRNLKTQELRGYLQPVAAVGASVSLTSLNAAFLLLQSVITGTSFSTDSLDFTVVTAPTPVTFEEVEQSLVRVTGGGAALIHGASAFIVTFDSATIQVYGPSGLPLATSAQLWQVIMAGENKGLGAGLSVAVGPLKRVDSI